VRLLDVDGRVVSSGELMPVPGDPFSTRTTLPSLADGTYTVSWRTVSASDGHVAVGAFAFAIGAGAVPPIPSIPPPQPISPSPLGVGGHWLLDAGYGLLLGGAWVALIAFSEISPGLLAVVGLGDLLGILGVGLIAEAGRENARMDWGAFASTAFAGSLETLLIPLVGAGLFVVIARAVKGTLRRLALGGTGFFCAVAMLANAMSSHAASSRVAWLMIPAQWLHLASFAVWIGGLTAILVGIRGRPNADKARAVSRFSAVALYAFAALGLSGVLRGIDDLSGIASLWTTTFGQLLLVKTALFVVITPLAATNRWRFVPMGVEGIRSLRRVSWDEVALATLIMVAAAFLTTLPPPSFLPAHAASRPFPEITASAVDSRGAVNVKLEAAPGRAGPNRLIATIDDARTGQPVVSARVFLLFDLAGHPELGESTLELAEIGGGSYTAVGTKLSLAGRWRVTVVVETATDTFDTVLDLTIASGHSPGP